MSALRSEKLSAGYVGVPVVRELDLHVEPGEVVALLGPNGAGKTTFVMTATGLLPAISGEIEILGEPLGRQPAYKIARRGVAFVPDDRALFYGLTALENLKLGPRSKGSVERVLNYFPSLERQLNARAGLLSGGEQQMLAIGRALVGEPKLLIIDELSLGLAPIIVQRILPVVRAIAEEMNTAVLLVEQHVQMALQVSDRAYVLNHGELVLTGSASELLADRQRLSSSYLGEMS